MWNKSKSLVLSKVCVLICVCLVLGVMIFGPKWVAFLIYMSGTSVPNIFIYLMITFYSGGVCAIVMLVLLYMLLYNIGKGKVFVKQNITLMRGISWLCILGAGICAVSSLYYVEWIYVGGAAGFIGLILRVVKNVIAEAVSIKEENDFTI